MSKRGRKACGDYLKADHFSKWVCLGLQGCVCHVHCSASNSFFQLISPVAGNTKAMPVYPGIGHSCYPP